MSSDPVPGRTEGPARGEGADERRVSDARRSITRRTNPDVAFAPERRGLIDRRLSMRRLWDRGSQATEGPGSGPKETRSPPRPTTTQIENNARMWSSRRLVPSYANATLEAGETLILARYRDALSGRVLDVGCGGGRILGYLVMLGAEAHGVDISPQMVEHCRRLFPMADVRQGDLSNLAEAVNGPFDAILLPDNLIDIYDDAHRRVVLSELRTLLAPEGVLVFSSHNLAAWERPRPTAAAGRRARALRLARALAKANAGALARRAQHAPRVWLNRRRLGPLQYREHDHAIVNDAAHEYGLLHYYIGRDDQARQLSEVGFRLLDVLELTGPSVRTGEDGLGPSLYYVATPAT
jgi:SAM-dependent methyltransferase